MNINTIISNEWELFQEYFRQVTQDIAELNRRLKNPCLDSGLDHLLREKPRLIEKIKKFNERILAIESRINNRLLFLKNREAATTDPQSQKDLTIKLKRSQFRLEKLKKANAPREDIEHDELVVWAIQTPIDEVREFFQREIEEAKRDRSMIAIAANEAQSYIERIDEYCRQSKKRLKEIIQIKEQEKRDFHTDIIDWGAQDRDHLEWMLKHEPHYKEEVISRYKGKFPNEDISAMVPAISDPKHARNGFRTYKKMDDCPPARHPVVAPQPNQQAWRFSITFKACDPGQQLPQRRERFLKTLKLLLQDEDYNDIDVKKAHKKIMQITRMDAQQRYKLKEVQLGAFQGWKIWALGEKRRFFLSINEEERHIRFVLRPRNESYIDND